MEWNSASQWNSATRTNAIVEAGNSALARDRLVLEDSKRLLRLRLSSWRERSRNWCVLKMLTGGYYKESSKNPCVLSMFLAVFDLTRLLPPLAARSQRRVFILSHW